MKSEDVERVLESVRSERAPDLDEEIRIDIDIEVDARGQRDDDRFLAKFIGFCVFCVGLITMIPAIYFLLMSSAVGDSQAIPRWTYLVGFIGATHLIYAIYVFQISDYSALQALSTFLLIVTCVYGFVVASVLLDETGRIPAFLQLSTSMVARAAIWSGVMFCITALSCYLIGRESLIWRRKQAGHRPEAKLPSWR